MSHAAPSHAAAPPPNRANWLLPLIGVGKLMKAAVLFGASFALRYLRKSDDMRQKLVGWAEAIHADPDGRHLHRLIDHVTKTDPHKIHFTAIALFVYASLFTAEGVGLILRKRWGEYVTVVVTSLLLPLEVYELAHPGHRAIKIALLILNLAVLVYLIWNLYRTRERHEPTTASPTSIAATPEMATAPVGQATA